MDNRDVWAIALEEAESPELRDKGLWARCYADSNGDEARAKAAYIRARAGGEGLNGVTDNASPGPGHPQGAAEPLHIGDDVVTTQQTAKRYKAVQAIGVVLILLAPVSCVAGIGGGQGRTVGLLVVGGLLYVGARVLAWWNHG